MHCLQAAADQISTHLQASVAGCIQRGRERNSSIVSPFIFGPGIFLATTSVRRVERAGEWGSCSTADLSSLSPSLCSGWADFSCLSRSLEKEEGEGGRECGRGRQLPLLLSFPPSVVHSHSLRLSNKLELLRSRSSNPLTRDEVKLSFSKAFAAHYRARQKGIGQVWRILLLLLLTTSA